MGVMRKIEAAVSHFKVNQETKKELDEMQVNIDGISKIIPNNELVEMVKQSRKLKSLTDNHRKWLDLYRKLREMKDGELNNINFDLQKLT